MIDFQDNARMDNDDIDEKERMKTAGSANERDRDEFLRRV
jgi:hypothetical protein